MSTLRPLLPILVTLIFSLPCKAGDPLELETTEQIGPLKLGLPASRVQVLLESKPKLGPKQMWEADGAYHQSWDYERQGISLDMVADTQHSPQSINKIVVSSPCRFSTQRGIHIGSTESEVEQAYRKDLNEEESTKGQALVAGSMYGGLIFGIEKGKVADITLGAVAE